MEAVTPADDSQATLTEVCHSRWDALQRQDEVHVRRPLDPAILRIEPPLVGLRLTAVEQPQATAASSRRFFPHRVQQPLPQSMASSLIKEEELRDMALGSLEQQERQPVNGHVSQHPIRCIDPHQHRVAVRRETALELCADPSLEPIGGLVAELREPGQIAVYGGDARGVDDGQGGSCVSARCSQPVAASRWWRECRRRTTCGRWADQRLQLGVAQVHRVACRSFISTSSRMIGMNSPRTRNIVLPAMRNFGGAPAAAKT